MSIIRGGEGWIKIKASGSANYINARYVTQWQGSLSTTQVTAGPFLNDGNRTYSFSTSQQFTGSLDITLPINRTDVHTALLNHANSGIEVGLRLISKGGYTWEIPSGILTGYNVTNSAADAVTISFDFTDNGGFRAYETTTTDSSNE